MLVRVLADRDATRRRLLATPLACSKWGRLLPADQMAAALVDRLAHPGPRLLFDGDRYRMPHALMKER